MSCRRRMFVEPQVGDELVLADGKVIRVVEVVGLDVAVEVISRTRERLRRAEWELHVLGAFAVVPAAAASSNQAEEPE